MGDLKDSDNNRGYSWEKKYKRSWDVFEADESISLQRLVTSVQMQMKRTNADLEAISAQRGVIRHLVLVLDLSESMSLTDIKPDRCSFMLSLMENFISEFFDQNPLSHLGIVAIKEGLAYQLSRMCCNFSGCIGALKKKGVSETKGQASLQNALELSNILLSNTTLDGSKEILVILGSLSSHDPGNIFDTIEKLKRNEISVNVIGFSAEIHICTVICKETKGTYNIILNEDHFKDLLSICIPPKYLSTVTKARLIEMGFPSLKRHTVATLCMCHRKLIKKGYLCPRCYCFVCNISTICPVCKLTLISSPLLARSYYHLFPASPFEDVSQEYNNYGNICFGCQKTILTIDIEYNEDVGERMDATPDKPPIEPTIKTPGDVIPDKSVNRCRKCSNIYCSSCDLFIHKMLHNCPGCMLKTSI